MNVLTISVTEPGRTVAERLPFARVHGDPARHLHEQWDQVDAFVVVLAVGATVRLLAPLLRDKASDPAVVCVDDAGRWAVVVCGGHVGGGNDLARSVNGLIGAEAVITTATDRLGIPALDTLRGFTATGSVAEVTSILLAGQPIELGATNGWPVPDVLAERAPDATKVVGAARIIVTDLLSPDSTADDRPTVLLHPPSLVIGIGTSLDATPAEVRASVNQVAIDAGLAIASVAILATIDRRANHPGITALAESLNVEIKAFDAATLGNVSVPTPSDVVRAAVGTPSVAEAAALLAAGQGGTLVIRKTVTPTVTVAVARRVGPSGSVAVVGLGPGGPSLRTPAATAAVRRADIVVGFSGYIEQCADLLSEDQRVERYDLGQEVQRARAALRHAAKGRHVALVCSGDPGIYAMASPLIELATDESDHFGDVTINVVPGVTAGSTAAALLGAPIGHDHAVISLSDLHTKWEHIERRLVAAAESDLVVVLYNPRSRRRQWQLEQAQKILGEHRPPNTPVGLVTDGARPHQVVRLTTLAALPLDEVTMTTCVVIGSSTTRSDGQRMFTPRGYDR